MQLRAPAQTSLQLPKAWRVHACIGRSEMQPTGVMSYSLAIPPSQLPAGRGMMMTTAAGQG